MEWIGMEPTEFGAIGVLAAVVAYLWRWIAARIVKIETNAEALAIELRDCQEDRVKIWRAIANQNPRAPYCEGCEMGCEGCKPQDDQRKNQGKN